MAGKEIPLESEALRVNIAGTAFEATIPEKYQPLLDAVQGLVGVRDPLRDTLREYLHPMRNDEAVQQGLQTVLLRNWGYFERGDDRLRLFDLMADIVLDMLAQTKDEARASLLLRLLFSWLLSIEKGRRAEEYHESTEEVARRLAGQLIRHPVAFLERDALLRELASRRLKRGSPEIGFAELYRSLTLQGYRRAADRLDVPNWAGTRELRLADPDKVVQAFPDLSGGHLRTRVAALEAAAPPQVLSEAFVPFSGLLDQAVGGIFALENLEDRFLVCLFFLKDDTLGFRQHEVMVDLLRVVKDLLEPGRDTDFGRLLARLTRFFHRREQLFPDMRFLIYQAVGEAIGDAGASRAADLLIDDLLSWPFEYPEVLGATDEWRTIANPYHLANVRCWLRIVESNPLLYERLAAALNVQLRLGGAFIADTDLFQRDITRFLNADIRSIYFVAKQLLRSLPAYFNELGAEGELRSVSTEIDEVVGRRDTLMHFLRKQVHAESSNRLIDFNQAVLRYWVDLDPSVLEPFVSPNTIEAVRRERDLAEGPHRLLVHLAAGRDGDGLSRGLPEIVTFGPDRLEELLAQVPSVQEHDRRRLALVIRQDQLLREKYGLSSGDLGQLLERSLRLSEPVRRSFKESLSAWCDTGRQALRDGNDLAVLPAQQEEALRDQLLDASLDVLAELKGIILDRERSAGVENIYHKRHIAAGIPSMYGNYTEPKFDALALTFRVERLVSVLFEQAAGQAEPELVTRGGRRRMAGLLRRLERALDLDGIHSRNLSGNLALLEASLDRPDFSFRQHQNVVQFLAQSVSDLVRISTLSHDEAMRSTLEHDPREAERRGLSEDALAEVVLRDILVSALGLQSLDRYVSRAVRQAAAVAGRLDDHVLTRLMHFDAARLISWIHADEPDLDDQVTLGYKALGLKHLARYGHQVPQGFVLTTELFSVRSALEYAPFREDIFARVRDALHQLEDVSGLRLGDGKHPLLLSIRSGSAISLPGLMMTFVNVGLNDELTQTLAGDPDFAWTAWDSYRRYLQSWAMSAGVERDLFDGVMADFKERHGVGQKLEFSAAQMKQIALAYKAVSQERGVVFLEDPVDQVAACVRQVLLSWETEPARLFRNYLGVAEEWGTAVIVQRMVLGNRSRSSGAGVTFTRNPRQPHTRMVRLFGDFAVGGQGEDLVGGLVFPLPISEAQRKASGTYRGIEHSLERDFTEIYQGLLSVAHDLVTDREYDPQEIEFTFESPRREDLYILQKRPMVGGFAADLPVFDMRNCDSCELPTAVGVGVSGGAYAGRVAVTTEQIDALLEEDPETPIVLLRPDTVPEDLALILRAQAILTARGGSTSHAAVTAKRLGKIAVVDCRALEVREGAGRARLAGQDLGPGDWVSIDGRSGHIYIGKLPTIRPGEASRPEGADRDGAPEPT